MKRHSRYQTPRCLILILGFCCCASCGSDEECFTPPAGFALDIRDEDGSSILSLYEAADIQLYYLNEESEPVPIEFRKEGVITSDQLPLLSIAGENPFYLEVDAKTDTLVVDVVRDRSVSDNCTAYFYSYVGVNGESAVVETLAPDVPPVFIVNR